LPPPEVDLPPEEDFPPRDSEPLDLLDDPLRFTVDEDRPDDLLAPEDLDLSTDGLDFRSCEDSTARLEVVVERRSTVLLPRSYVTPPALRSTVLLRPSTDPRLVVPSETR
jgi:hypothetical protein